MGAGKAVYNLLFKRQSTFMVTIIASAFVFERTFDIVSDGIFRNRNKGVSIRFFCYATTAHDKCIN